MSGDAAMSVSDLGKAFGGFRAVDGVTFAVRPAEVVALIGPNGAGKTTTFNIINGQLRPDRGEVHVAGENVTGLGPRALWRRGIGRTFQITATFLSMTVAENVAVALLPVRTSLWRPTRLPTLGTPEVSRLVADVGLAGQEDRICGTLDYGNLKRVELAMALANRPHLLLMDEPTAGMASAERQSLMSLAVDVAAARGAAVLFTEHDMGLVFRHAHRVLVMSGGRLIAEGTPAEIRASAVVREVYLGRSAGAAGDAGTTRT